MVSTNITHTRHPGYIRDQKSWEEWREAFEGGKDYLTKCLKQFQGRETATDFALRKELTPIATFAKSALLDVRNNIYQRLVTVTRNGGSPDYQSAIRGEGGGVDGEGSSMDAFIGKDVLTELLLMGRVGCYIDAAEPTGPTMADDVFPPYLTYYRVENILSWSRAPRGKGGEFQSVLLRDWNVTIETAHANGLKLPNGSEEQYRLIWKDDFGVVWYKIYDNLGQCIFQPNSVGTGEVETNLLRVPFVMFDIGESLMKDVSSFQKALLNLTSNDVYYALRSNTPFLAVQKDGQGVGQHLNRPEGTEGAQGNTIIVGTGKGYEYGLDEDAPAFIAPPSEPLQASMQLQAKLEDSIRTLINLSVQSKSGSRTESGEAKKIGQGGLEAGLSFIGMELAEGERLIAAIWAEYENVTNPDAATVSYPKRYTLKSDDERLEEAAKLVTLIEKLPTQELKRQVSKDLVDMLLGGKHDPAIVEGIKNKIDTNDYILSDPQMILQAHKAGGLVDNHTASDALGFRADKVVALAEKDREERIAQTLLAQTSKDDQEETGGLTNPASRGAPELDINPSSGEDEKEKDD